MRVLPTATGVKGLLLLVLLLLAFFATDYSNLFFLVIAFSIVLGVSGAVAAHRNLRSVQLVGLEVPMAPAATARPLQAPLHTKSAFDVGIEALLDGRWTPLLHTALARGEHVVHGELPARPRGIATATALRVTSRFPFGFVRAIRTFALPTTIVTYPALAAGHPAHAGRSATGADLCTAGRGAEVVGLRGFRAGDSLTDVHWKATARRGAPVVKERHAEASPRPTVVLDRRLPHDAFERALVEATARVLSARDAGERLRLCSQDCDLDGSAPDAQLRWLAATQPLPDDAPPPPQPPGAELVGRTARRAAGHGNAPAKVLGSHG